METRRTGQGQSASALPDELLVAGVVHAFAEHLLPPEDEASDEAVTAAVRCYLSGASMSEACREGRRLVESQARHPSTSRARPDRAVWVVR